MSCIDLRTPHSGSHRTQISTSGRAAIALSVIVWAALFSACSKDDSGQCCRVLPGRNEQLIPQPETGPDGDPRSIVRIDPAFDCENLTCVSYKGSTAYCTKECAFDDGCPEGFKCEAVIVSNPGPDSNIGPGDKFCVRDQAQCLME